MKPTKKLLLKADYHMFDAYKHADAWYTVGGGTSPVAWLIQLETLILNMVRNLI